MKKVAMFIDSLAGGGAEKIVITLTQAMQALGHKVTLFVLDKKIHYELPDELSIVYLQSDPKHKTKGWFNRQKNAKRLNLLVEEQQNQFGHFDLFLVHLQESYRIVSACNFAPCFYVVHNSLKETLQREKRLGPVKYYYLRSALRKLHKQHLIAVSNGIKTELNCSKIIQPSSIKTIYNPFDLKQINTLAKAPEPNLPKNKYIVHVGRFAKQKRHDILFEALQNVSEGYKLVCLCRVSKKMTKLIKKMRLEHRVMVTGFVQNPYTWIKQAELLVLSSDYEGLPTVLIEALACGTPVVSTNCPHGPDEIMTEALSEYLVPKREPEQLANKINQALNANIDVSQSDILCKVQAKYIAQQYLALCG
jgi:glycosyltransferase involved in cell wall biosynthesis